VRVGGAGSLAMHGGESQTAVQTGGNGRDARDGIGAEDGNPVRPTITPVAENGRMPPARRSAIQPLTCVTIITLRL
jgi:hypothetical protein